MTTAALTLDCGDEVASAHARLRLFTLTIAVGAFGLYLFESIGDALVHHERPWWLHWFDAGDMTALLLAAAAGLGAYALGSSRPWRVPVGSADSVAALAPAALGTLAGVLDPEPARMATAALLFVAGLVLVRAALVPSPPRRTAVLGMLASGIAFLGILWMDAQDPSMSARELARTALRGAVVMGGVVLIATTISRLMEGLVRAAHAAQLGHYELGERLGAGGMGEVYRATHRLMRRATAIKLLPSDRQGEIERLRFEREAMLTSQLAHPNTIAVYDYGLSEDRRLYLVMELVHGWNLQELVERFGPMSAGRVVHTLIQVCGSLGEAHELGLIHRDIKPSNVMLCERAGEPDVVKVLDFGLARIFDPGGPMLTKGSAFVGTPHFAAPEAIRGETLGPRTDLYAVGAVGYFLLTGRTPFDGETLVEVCYQHLNVEPERPSTLADVPAALEALVLACLAKDPAARPASAAALRTTLERCRLREPWSRELASTWWRDHAASLRLPR